MIAPAKPDPDDCRFAFEPTITIVDCPACSAPVPASFTVTIGDTSAECTLEQLGDEFPDVLRKLLGD